MIITEEEELVSGCRFYVDHNSSIKIAYHELGVDPDFSESPEITREDGMVSFDAGTGTKLRCSIEPITTEGGPCEIHFISTETVL